MRVLPSGSTALLVELDDLDEVLALYATLADDVPEGVVDIVPAARTLPGFGYLTSTTSATVLETGLLTTVQDSARQVTVGHAVSSSSEAGPGSRARSPGC